MTQQPAVLTKLTVDPKWGEHYGVNVWMFRKGQRVRFYDADGNQHGPEHKNVMPAICWVSGQAWIDPFNVDLSLACTVEVRSQTSARRLAALSKQERGAA